MGLMQYNALESLQAFDMGKTQKKERDREFAMKGVGNALASGDYESGAAQAFAIDPMYGMQIRQYGDQRNALNMRKGIGAKLGAGDYKGGMSDAFAGGELEMGSQIMSMMEQMDRSSREKFAFGIQESAAVAGALLQYKTPEERKQALMSDPMLQRRLEMAGIPLDQALNAPMDDGALSGQMRMGMTAAEMLQDQRWTTEFGYRQSQDAQAQQNWETSQRTANAPRSIWQSAGEGAIFNQATGEYKQVSGGQGGFGAGTSGDPATDNFYIPTSGMADNPFLQLQFGANLTQGAPTLFDNGELYTPGGQGGQPGGGTPPNIDPGMYERYRSSEYAKNDAKIQKQARESAVQITTQVMPQIAQMKQLAREFPSGALSDLRYEAGRWVPFTRGNVGMTESQMAARDSFVSQAKTYVLSLAENMKGSLSDSDRVWVESMGAKTNMNDESIQQVLNVAEKMAERQEFYAQGAEVWSNQYGGLSMTDQNGKNFYQAWSEWSSMNPITGGTYGGDSPTSGTQGGTGRSRGEVQRAKGGQQYEATATNPQTGEKIGLINGKWVPIQ